jgi:hypothetical protein
MSYVTAHLQIADGKAAGVIAYISVLSGYAASKVSLSEGLPPGFSGWLALIGGGIGLIALILAFMVVKPRRWQGRDPADPFSWVGLSSAASADPYPERLSRLTSDEIQRGLADTVETCSLIIAWKYRFVTAAILSAMVSTIMQVASWIVA